MIQIKDFTEPIRLENNTIDNRDKKTTISLKNVIFWIGYFNIHKSLNIKWRVRFDREDGDQFSEAKEYSISPGYYNIDHRKDILERNIPWLKVALDNSRGEIIYHAPGKYEIKLPNEFITLAYIFIAIKSRLAISYLMLDHLHF